MTDKMAMTNLQLEAQNRALHQEIETLKGQLEKAQVLNAELVRLRCRVANQRREISYLKFQAQKAKTS